MRVVALISGGKDSCYNMMQCVSAGHQIVALANLRPPESAEDELDSYMYQTVGHHALELYAEAMGLPLYRATLQGTSLDTGRAYTPQDGDEVEDLYRLLSLVKEKESVDCVSVGAILSDYQRVRVENVCQRLGLQPLAFLWRRQQEELLDEMISRGLQAILIKVAAFGLDPDKHLGKTLEEMRPHLKQLSDRFGVHVCGEGGEYETLTLDCPLFKKRIVVDSKELMMHSNDAFAPVAYLRLQTLHLEDKVENSALVLEGECPCTVVCATDLVPGATDECGGIEKQPISWGPRGLPSVPSCKIRNHSARSQSGYQWISEVTAYGENVLDASQRGFSSLKDQVQEMGLKMKDTVLVHLYVRNMEDFATINTVYGTLFHEAPPARVCVQCCIQGDALFKVDALFWVPPINVCIDDHVPQKISMHVQSISHWAPANIGPYSQAMRVGPVIFCAGQIALKPCTMQLVPGGITVEVGVSLHHVNSVLDAVSPGTSLNHVMLAHCYVTRHSYIPTAMAAWRDRHAKDTLTSLSVAVVPQLPRGAAVEWHVVAAASDPAEWQYSSLSEHGAGLQAMLNGVFSSGASCASLTLSLCVPPHVTPNKAQDWCGTSDLLRKALRRALEEILTDTPLTPLCCRTFHRSEGPESQSLRAGLQDILGDIWGDQSPNLVLLPVTDLPGSEILHMSFWFSS
ncbi:diphthine--ammonia ligase [Rhinophrynus dorsalis]